MEHPLLFSAEMVRALLADRKTQTRRLVKLRKDKQHPEWPIVPLDMLPMNDGSGWVTLMQKDPPGGRVIQYPMAAGDCFWVKENFRFIGTDMNRLGRTHAMQDGVFEYEADHVRNTIERRHQDIEKYMNAKTAGKLRPSIFMPRWVSRITLEIVKIRVERLQDISEEDADAEGVSFTRFTGEATSAREAYIGLWDSINDKRKFGWEVNPWVWVIEFKKCAETGETNG
jgi:hypothetical protein